MPKTDFAPDVRIDLTRRLQLVLLDALMSSGAWDPESLRFQGGTSLSLVYGSPRFSEDLDFIVGSTRGLKRAVTGAQTRMNNVLLTILPGARVRIRGRDDDPEAEAARNPRVFTATVEHPDWYRAVKIKMEFWVADPEAVRDYQAGVRTARVLQGVLGGPLKMALAPVMLPVADIEEIVVDKLHALVERAYLKGRDVFDLWYLRQQGHEDWAAMVRHRYDTHVRLYPGAVRPGGEGAADEAATEATSRPKGASEDARPVTVEDLGLALRAAAVRVAALAGRKGAGSLVEDLQRWLGPKHLLAQPLSVDAMVADVTEALGHCAEALEMAPSRAPSP